MIKATINKGKSVVELRIQEDDKTDIIYTLTPKMSRELGDAMYRAGCDTEQESKHG